MLDLIVSEFKDIRRGGKLLCRFDPERGLLEIKPRGGQAIIIDLAQEMASHRQKPLPAANIDNTGNNTVK